MSNKKSSYTNTANAGTSHTTRAANKLLLKKQPSSVAEITPNYDPQTEQQERLGTILQRIREHRGERIEEVARYLCIRVSYLIALENSEYEKLPADAYVIGFLKSYAAYLNLDDKGAVNQYRHEMAGRRRKPQLSMPQPMSEGRAPTITLMISAVVSVLLLYGIWYWLWAPDRSIVQQEPLLPSEQQENIDATEGAPPSEPSVVLDKEPAPEIVSIDTIVIEAKEADAVNEVPSGKIVIQKENPNQKDTVLNISLDAPTVSLKPRIFGTSKKSNVTIIAEQKSWILITDKKGLTVFDYNLKTGESYRVPARKGLRLTTGNPQKINFKINGKDMPKLSTKSKVARSISLNTDKLKNILNGDN